MDAELLNEPSSTLPAAADGGNGSQSLLKRKRSPSSQDGTPVATKSAKSSSNHLTINYLARQYSEDLPLISTEDPLPAILSLLNEYQAVLERHESMACNLGARPIGPILMSRFERLFDGPPTILKIHNGSKSSELSIDSQPKVNWLDVVEFARTKTSQFQLSAMSEGRRVCQFYTKQCRVQISEEDFLLIQSGMPQKLIPPQPIIEDEEKELGTLEILEKVLGGVREVADQVAARTRQLNHRIKARKQAILDRRASDTGVSYTATSPTEAAMVNGASISTNGSSNGSASTPVGFVAVNARQVSASNGVSQATRNDLMSKFSTLSERKANAYMNGYHEARISLGAPLTTLTGSRGGASQAYDSHGHASPLALSLAPRSPHAKAQHSAEAGKDDPQPHRAAMTAHVESLKKGERIQPPCDRCRRLQMDCVKNLTACQGCTRKHARCAWKEVRRDELRALAARSASSSSSAPAEPAPADDSARALDAAAAASLAAAAQAVSADADPDADQDADQDADLDAEVDALPTRFGFADGTDEGRSPAGSLSSAPRSDSDAERDRRAWGPTGS